MQNFVPLIFPFVFFQNRAQMQSARYTRNFGHFLLIIFANQKNGIDTNIQYGDKLALNGINKIQQAIAIIINNILSAKTLFISLQLSILQPSCRRVCGGGRRFLKAILAAPLF